MMNKIAVLGANPALQKTMFFKEFRYGEVNRARRLESFPSGKGINFCRAAASWGRAAGVLFQFSGGENGKFVTDGITAEGFVVQFCCGRFKSRSSIGERLLVTGNVRVDGSDLRIVCGNRTLFDSALLRQVIGDLAVAFKLGQCRAVFVGIGILGIFQNRDANLNVNSLCLKCANILKCLRYVGFQLVCLCRQVCLLLGKFILFLSQALATLT